MPRDHLGGWEKVFWHAESISEVSFGPPIPRCTTRGLQGGHYFEIVFLTHDCGWNISTGVFGHAEFISEVSFGPLPLKVRCKGAIISKLCFWRMIAVKTPVRGFLGTPNLFLRSVLVLSLPSSATRGPREGNYFKIVFWHMIAVKTSARGFSAKLNPFLMSVKYATGGRHLWNCVSDALLLWPKHQ